MISEYILSKTAQNLIGSQIRKISGEINERIEKGEKIYNLTIGDFSPKVFPIPAILKEEIIKAYSEDQTNYPPAEGVKITREAVSQFLKERGGIEYKPSEILIGAGARPLTYSLFLTVVDPGDTIIYPAPSWNNNCYVQLSGAKGIPIETTPETNFMPTADLMKPHIGEAALIALNSPLNPSGTAYSKDELKKICEMVVEENKRRGKNKKPVYLFFDQIYWILTYGDVKHFNPVELCPDIRDYIIFVDGISKCFASTGVRVGWAFGPKPIIDKMNSIMSHIGAWAPKPEQIGLARFLQKKNDVDRFFIDFKNELMQRLTIFYDAFIQLKSEGYKVDAISPQGAIYLTVKLDLTGMKTQDGKILKSTDDVLKYILAEAKMALVPFYAFGASKEMPWYRLSVGTCSVQDAHDASDALRNALHKLTFEMSEKMASV
jgi:aspartate aminotransferase